MTEITKSLDVTTTDSKHKACTGNEREGGERLRERVKERWVSAGVQDGPCHLSYIQLRNMLNT